MSGARRPCPDCTHNVLITDDGQHLAHHYARPISAGGPCTGSGSPITATADALHVDGLWVMGRA